MKQNSTPGYSRVLTRLLFPLFLIYSATSFSQTVKGTVSDANNQPVVGVTVQVKNTSKATTTNNAGQFEINASGTDVLVFSSVGFINAAIARQGPDKLDTKVWWDK